MADKICRGCGATILIGLDYCPSCLRSQKDPVKPAPRATVPEETRLERLQSKWSDLVARFTISQRVHTVSAAEYDRRNLPATEMSEPYTRVVCPACQNAYRAPANQPPSSRLICTSCFHQFPASMASEFRKGADLHCYHCNVTTFVVNGLKVNKCPNCKTDTNRKLDPELVILIALGAIVGMGVLVGFGHAVANQTIPQFLTLLVLGILFVFVSFIAMVALGF